MPRHFGIPRMDRALALKLGAVPYRMGVSGIVVLLNDGGTFVWPIDRKLKTEVAHGVLR